MNERTDSTNQNEPSLNIIVLIHGIRTQGSWGEMVAAVLENTGPVKVIPVKYGYLDVFRFLSPLFTRKEPIRKIVRELRDIRAANPTAQISVIAHSFGTYAIMKALKEREIKLYRLLFCGSIIPESFRRADFEGQLGNDDILNECGTHDIWPAIAKSVTWGYGASGTFGFGTVGVRDRYHKLGHSDYFNKSFVEKYWAPFLLRGEVVPTKWEEERSSPPWWQSMVAWFPFKYIILSILAFFIALSVYIFIKSGEIQIKLGDDIIVGHYLGVPYMVERIYYSNTTRYEQYITNLNYRLLDPTGKEVPMSMESIILSGVPSKAFSELQIQPNGRFWFDYSFFNYTNSFLIFKQKLRQYIAENNIIANAPDLDKKLLSLNFAEKARTLANSEFIWKPGKWKIRFSGKWNGKVISDEKGFTLSKNEVSSMKSIIDHYQTGIGVFPNWRFYSSGKVIPVLTKIVDDTN